MTMLRVPASYYQQFDADWSLDVPAEGYGGWRHAELELARERTALVVMHAWDVGTREEFPGWHRAVEYIPRAEAICRDVFPGLLGAFRRSGMRLYHVVGGGDYYRRLPGYRAAAELAGPAPSAPGIVAPDPSLEALRRFREERVFVGAHNAGDVRRGFARLGFAPNAEPRDEEGVAEDGRQLLALCGRDGVNHLLYAGFAINWCLLLSPGGMAEMARYGLMCSAIRDAVTAVENRETARDELCKRQALWRVALAFGFVFSSADLIAALTREG
ncbi:MAG: hypothetical protein IT208_12825 [Chthonomonadales bacterium]|nr:hypothetical protein [Chthonomonadales bacterium]